MRSVLRLGMALGLLAVTVVGVSAEAWGRPAFRAVWERTDLPVQRGVATHSWIWGPEPFTPVLEEWYADTPGERRAVQYIDKSRMEINNPAANPNSPWFVTNGLLVREMIVGDVQVGNLKFIPLAPARIAVAGDPGSAFPTYADLQRLYLQPSIYRVGDYANKQLTAGATTDLPQYAGAGEVQIVGTSNSYGIPRVFQDFMNRGGTIYQNGRFVQTTRLIDPTFVLGIAITDPYWARVRIGGVERDVLFQAFERRILTYTPGNPAQYRVEMGNVGRHYYQWRYVDPFAGGKQALITDPRGGAVVGRTLRVKGFENGQAFEARITIRIRTTNNNVLVEESTDVRRPDILIPGPFEVDLAVPNVAADTPATLEIVVFSENDGSERILDSINITVARTN